jgi:NAD(P)-dependent dehydrogenase (short-subunit alcohol dehydrogenase family)
MLERTQFDLTGKIAVVTGALGKLGPTWCRALLEAGAKVAALDLAGAKPSENYAALAVQFAEDRLKYFPGDVTKRDQLVAAREQIHTHFGGVDILVNNAGIDQPPSKTSSFLLQDIPYEQFTHVVEVNVAGAFLCSQVFGPDMLAKCAGSIINIGSLYASVSPDVKMYDHIKMDPPFIKPPAYAASKAALLQLTRYFAAHWGPHGVRVNAISPGGIEGGQDTQFKEKFARRVPLGRLGEQSDLTGPAVFLASAASLYVTGQNLQVDGGFTTW